MSRLKISLAAVLLLVGHGVVAHAQTQKGYPANPESEAEPEGGYQAPPGAGRMAGSTRQLAVEGLEVEFPTFKLKLPRLTLPCFTSYHTPPRMLLDEAVAPYVRQYREEFSVEAGPKAAAPESGDEPPQKSQDLKPTQQPVDEPEIDGNNELAERLKEFEQRELALENRIDGLQHAIEQLVTALETRPDRAIEATHRTPLELQPLPTVEHERYPVRRTSFLSVSAIRSRLERLPAVGEDRTTRNAGE